MTRHDDDFTRAARRAHIRPVDRPPFEWIDDNRGAQMLARVLIVAAVAVTVALVTVGPETWWTERNAEAVDRTP